MKGVLMNGPPQLALCEPSVYHIHIQGSLDETWGDYFGGDIVSTSDETDPSMTTLRTLPMDQAALVGLVNRLHGLGLLLLYVEHVCVEDDRWSVNHKPQS
jgi:hypothetical protein